MPKSCEKLFLFISDFLTIHLAFFTWVWLRRELGFFAESGFWMNMKLSQIIFTGWFLLFLFFGLYRSWYMQSRIDELVALFKVVVLGVFLIFLLTMDIENDLTAPPSLSRILIISYGILMVFGVGLGRLILHTIQRKLLEAGIGLRNTVIVGWNDKARELLDKLEKFPALGYKVIGFVDTSADSQKGGYKNSPVLGSLKQLADIVRTHKIEEIIIAVGQSFRKKVVDVIAKCDGLPVNLKIVPDLYDIILGQARTNQIYGFPLIEIMPELMPPWEKRVKRILDVTISLFVLLVFLPLWILIAVAIKLTSKGPVFFKQKRVGKDGRIFTIYKFRSMYEGAEKMTGPVWAEKKDPRITPLGRVLRKLRIDEIPQFFNVLNGDMSFIGPRPERPYFVDRLKRKIPLYTRRLRVKPGITGWAQIKGDYDSSLESVKKKLEYDLFYLENMSLRMDLKILLNTIYVMIAGKGR